MNSIIVTGASGFIGRYFLEAAQDDYLIYAIARRSQKEAGVPEHPHVKWLQADIANWESLQTVMHTIQKDGGADFILHLAGYYDFSNEDNPEYDRTNVKGTRNVLEFAEKLRPRRFIFASSLAACSFSRSGATITEQSPVDADFPYAISKRKGEELVREYSPRVPASILRLAAVFSDWCEYAPLYMFLSTWLSGKWNSRILGGQGKSAVPYIHITELNNVILTILRKSDTLPQIDTYSASPDGCVSHRELYEPATRYFFGKIVRPIFFPAAIAYPGVLARELIGKLTKNPPFERRWMLRYIDLKLNTDSSYTRKALGWEPAARYHIRRRLLFMIEKMKSRPVEWQLKNEAALKHVTLRPKFVIYEELVSAKEELVKKILEYMLSPARSSKFGNYRAMAQSELEWYIGVFYDLLTMSIRTGDRTILLDYIDDLVEKRLDEGFEAVELFNTLLAINNIILIDLHSKTHLKGLELEFHDQITITLQLVADEIEDCYERFLKRKSRPQTSASQQETKQDMERIINQLNAFYQLAPESEISKER